jgi:transposase InsO family protein
MPCGTSACSRRISRTLATNHHPHPMNDGPGGFTAYPPLKISRLMMNLSPSLKAHSLQHTIPSTPSMNQLKTPVLHQLQPYTNSPSIAPSEDPTPISPASQPTTIIQVPNDTCFTVHEYPALADDATVRLITHHPGMYQLQQHTIRVHVDGGANRSVTNNSNILTHFRNIKKYAMQGVADGPAIHCTAMGFFPWQSDAGEVLHVKCYFCPEVAETIVSPTDIVNNHINDLKAWGQHCDLDTGTGWIRLYPRVDTLPPIIYTLHKSNNLWYHVGTSTSQDYEPPHPQPRISHLTAPAQYKLWHQRLGHPGERVMSIVHLHIDQIPPLRGTAFYKCSSCAHAILPRRHHTSSSATHKPAHETPIMPTADPDTTQCGQHFSIDFGFMKGSGYSTTDKDGYTITSIDGYRAYLIIVDRHSRFTWIFLTKSKTPPLEIITTFLKQHGQPNLPHKTIRTDEGGELWNCQSFRQCALHAGYLLEHTAAGAPSQNGLAERPNLTLSIMVRCLLHSAAFGPEFWSFALLHAVYLKNRLPHAATGQTLYFLYTGKRPSARELRIFGCHIIAKQPGKLPTKLDSHTCTS